MECSPRPDKVQQPQVPPSVRGLSDLSSSSVHLTPGLHTCPDPVHRFAGFPLYLYSRHPDHSVRFLPRSAHPPMEQSFHLTHRYKKGNPRMSSHPGRLLLTVPILSLHCNSYPANNSPDYSSRWYPEQHHILSYQYRHTLQIHRRLYDSYCSRPHWASERRRLPPSVSPYHG